MKHSLVWMMTALTLMASNALAYNNPHILDVDLSIEGVEDPYKVSPGGFVAKDGLKRIFLNYTGVNLPTKTRLNWDSDKIEVVGPPDGTDEIYWDPASMMPTQLWVRGLAASATGPDGTNGGPEHLCLEAINNGTPYVAPLYDRIAFTVYEVTNIIVIPKGMTTNDTLPTPVTIGAGAMDSEAHQADVTIQITPPISGVPVDVSLLDGRGHDAGKDAKLVMGTATATGGCAAVTVLTGAGGQIQGVLTSSDVEDGLACKIHAGLIDRPVQFTWDRFSEEGEWTNAQEYLPVPGVLTNYLVLRHHRLTGAETPSEPFNDHAIRFFVETVKYWTNGVLMVTNNFPNDPHDLSAWAHFPEEPVMTDGDGNCVAFLTVEDRPDIDTVYMVAYDWSVWKTSAQAAGSGSATVQQQPESRDKRLDMASDKTADNSGITVTIEKCDADWDPKGGDEDNDNPTTIRAFVTPPTAKGKFKFTLFDVSDEPGYCLNAPQTIEGPEDTDTWKDLQFLPGQPGLTISGENNDVAETTEDNLPDATVTVKCFDYGAFGKIKVTFTPQDDSSTYVGTEEGGTKKHTNIPRDEAPENHIWDSADQNTGPNNTSAETDDNDNDPADIAATGDGITRYEEYRGFFVLDEDGNPKHKRTSVTKRDLFIYDPENLKFGFYPTASGVECHKIGATQWTGAGKRGAGKRIVDSNRQSWKDPDPAQVDPVYAIHLVNGDLKDRQIGHCISDDPPADGAGGPQYYESGTPSAYEKVIIDRAEMENKPEGWVKSTIAHEIGHSTCVKHHNTSYFPVNEGASPAYYGRRQCVMRYVAMGNISEYSYTHHLDENPESWWVKEFCPPGVNSYGAVLNDGCKKSIDVRSHKGNLQPGADLEE